MLITETHGYKLQEDMRCTYVLCAKTVCVLKLQCYINKLSKLRQLKMA